MKKIKTINIKNFQCWKNATLDFDNCLNVITGSSDSGKSSIMRAICAPLTGEMDIDWINFDEKEASVELIFADGTKARRTRNKKDNVVSFTDVDGKEFVWERIGKDLPQEYVEKLGSINVSIDDSFAISPCLHLQHDGHFFISLTDQQKSKLIGSISGVFIVDNLLTKLHSEVRDINKDRKDGLQRVEELNSNINEQNDNYSRIKSIFDSVNPIKELAVSKKSKMDSCCEVLDKYKANEAELSNTNENLKYVTNILSNCKLDNVDKLADMTSINEKYSSLVCQLNNSMAEIAKIDSVILNDNSSLDKYVKIDSLMSVNREYSELCEKLKECSNKIDTINQEIAVEKSKIKICPTCGAESSL